MISSLSFRSLAGAVLMLFALGAVTSSPATASVPAAQLRHDADWYKGEDAKRAAANILSHQGDAGGWPKNVDTSSRPFDGDRNSIQGTFDNSSTTDELRFLAKMVNATTDPLYRDAFDRGLKFVRDSQYPTGGWPQIYPPPASYHRHITFNDNAMGRTLEFLREVAHADGYQFLPAEVRQECQRRFDRGIDCILKCQVKVNGKLTVWCAQHDEVDLSPRPARSYELISLSGSESVGLVRILMSLENPSPEVIASVDAAAAWMEEAKLTGIRLETQQVAGAPGGRDRVVVQDPSAPPMWARFYEIGTNVPIYSGRDGVKKATLAEIEHERRNGYAWLGTWPRGILATEYPNWKKRLAAK